MLKPSKYNSSSVSLLASIETRRDKLGSIFYYVEIFHSHDVGTLGFRFEQLSSALDFIQSNLATK